MKCPSCKINVIEEEFPNHHCFSGKIKSITFDSDSLYQVHIFDGKKWLKCPSLKPHQPRGNTYNTTEEGTEPAIRNCYLIG